MNMKDFIKVMKALSGSNRVKILKILQEQSPCVCKLQFTGPQAASVYEKGTSHGCNALTEETMHGG